MRLQVRAGPRGEFSRDPLSLLRPAEPKPTAECSSESCPARAWRASPAPSARLERVHDSLRGRSANVVSGGLLSTSISTSASGAMVWKERTTSGSSPGSKAWAVPAGKIQSVRRRRERSKGSSSIVSSPAVQVPPPAITAVYCVELGCRCAGLRVRGLSTKTHALAIPAGSRPRTRSSGSGRPTKGAVPAASSSTSSHAMSSTAGARRHSSIRLPSAGIGSTSSAIGHSLSPCAIASSAGRSLHSCTRAEQRTAEDAGESAPGAGLGEQQLSGCRTEWATGARRRETRSPRAPAAFPRWARDHAASGRRTGRWTSASRSPAPSPNRP